jgi:nicotinamidase-related amidase
MIGHAMRPFDLLLILSVFLISSAATWLTLSVSPLFLSSGQRQSLRLEVVNRDFVSNLIGRRRLTLSTNDTLFYVDAWRAHWCPYYNDRAFYLTPRINEILHLARSRGFRTFHLHWKPHEADLDAKLRATAKQNADGGETQIIRDTWTDNGLNNSRYIPGFEDRCMYPKYERFGPTRDQKPNPTISVADSDYVAFNFKSIANIANFLNIKTVILMGMHTNLCIRSAAMYLALVNISVGYVDGLLDAGFYYPGQKKHGVASHSKMNRVTYDYAITIHGWGISGFNLMRALKKMPAVAKEPTWAMYAGEAAPFRRYYVTG